MGPVLSDFTNQRDDIVNARATVTVSNDNFDGSGQITSIVITDGGSGYNSDDILTVSGLDKTDPTDLNVSIDPTMNFLNSDIIDQYGTLFFVVDAADYAAMEAALLHLEKYSLIVKDMNMFISVLIQTTMIPILYPYMT